MSARAPRRPSIMAADPYLGRRPGLVAEQVAAGLIARSRASRRSGISTTRPPCSGSCATGRSA